MLVLRYHLEILRESGGDDAAASGAAQRGLRAALKRSIVKVDLAVPEI